MGLPVSLQTDRLQLQDLARIPELGGLIVLMLALGPPTAVALCAVAADLVHYLITGATWGFIDLELLLKVPHERLDAYDREYPRLVLAKRATSQKTRDRVGDLGALGLTLNEARSLVSNADREARMLGELLRSLHRLPVSQDVDFTMIRGLSSLTPSVAEFCANALDERLDTSDLVDAMFSYIADKSEFMVREVNVYENILRRQGPPGADGIAANLERLIHEKGGSPDDVFWIYKKMGFALLGELGAVEHMAVLERYLSDTTSYIRSKTRGEATKIRFADACSGALARIKLRASDS